MTSAIHIEIDDSPAVNRQSAISNLQSQISNRQFGLARLLLILTLIAAPWAFGAVEPWGWTALGLAACAILLLWALGSTRQRVLTLVWSPIYLPLALFFAIGAVQYVAHLTLDRAETRQALVLLATDLLFFFLALQLFSNATAATWRAFGFVALLLGAALGLFAMLQFAAGEQRIYGQVDTPGNLLFGPYVNPNHFAGLMEMLIPVGVFSIIARTQIVERTGIVAQTRKTSLALLLWLGVGAAIMIAALLLSGSRGGLLALAAEIVIGLGVVGNRKFGIRNREFGIANRELEFESWVPSPEPRTKSPTSRTPRAPNLAAALATAILVTVLLFTWIDPGVVARKLSLIVDVGGPAWTEWAGFRKAVASDSLRMLRDHPAAGVGLGDFETAYPRYQSFPSDMWIDFAHNDYVQALAETGLAGGVLMLAALGMFLHLAFGNRDPRRGSRHPAEGTRDEGPEWRLSPELPTTDSPVADSEPDPLVTRHSSPLAPGPWSPAPLIRLGAALGCCGMLVHSFFDFNLHIPANAAWFAVLAGIAVARASRP